MKARIQLREVRSFMELIKNLYSPYELKNAEISIMETINGGFVIKYNNIIKRIIVVDLKTGFYLSYEQLNNILNSFCGEIDMEFELEDNKQWLMNLQYKDKTILVERNTFKFIFNYDIKFTIKWSELINLIENNNEFKIGKEGFENKESFKIKFNERDKANLVYFLSASLEDKIVIKIKDDTVFLFEKPNGTYFKVMAESIEYIEE